MNEQLNELKEQVKKLTAAHYATQLELLKLREQISDQQTGG